MTPMILHPKVDFTLKFYQILIAGEVSWDTMSLLLNTISAILPTKTTL
jgi:hypothetical protein